MRFIAFDLELTCEQDILDYPHQIIEIGAVLFENDEFISGFQSFVQPVSPYQVTSFCTTLTGISAAQVSTAQLPIFSGSLQGLAGLLKPVTHNL
ncbi:exonuclease domain-containing protein [Arsukibacterium sp. MJ3]|uniref:exonuclease domain-containing protein n=1 Tax=Arsukibacterium sp. MJ3 TaxID=1632859 RepID=UPI00069932EA|nr:exonuclease domain-containing protein [Arsukibacterium sp. MJ3]